MIRLLELRTEKGWSQRKIAGIMNISQGTYNNWENGRTQPSIEQLIEFSALFSVSVDYLIGNTDEYGTVQIGALTSEEKKILKKISSLKEEAQSALLEFLEKI